MTATYFSSDWHINHQNVCNFRKEFTTVKEHNELIFDNYCSIVRPKDHVYMLGDMAFDLEAVHMIGKLPGIKHIILGNHDLEKKRGVTIQDLLSVYSSINGFIRYKEFWLSHCPIHFDELRGRYLVHGHTHNHLINDPRYLNVCLEQTDYKPISLEQIRLIFEFRKEEIEKITNV